MPACQADQAGKATLPEVTGGIPVARLEAADPRGDRGAAGDAHCAHALQPGRVDLGGEVDQVRVTRARAAILDLSGVSILYSSDFESVLRTLRMVRLMSATPVIVGLGPGVAASLVELGVSADDIKTCMSLEKALELVDRVG